MNLHIQLFKIVPPKLNPRYTTKSNTVCF